MQKREPFAFSSNCSLLYCTGYSVKLQLLENNPDHRQFYFSAMYTEELIKRLIKYYAIKHRQTISAETAEIYLNSLADLFDSSSRILSEKKDLKNTDDSGIISA